VCLAPFSRLFQEAESRPRIDPAKAAVRSLLFPGLGHVATGRRVEGVARAVLFAWCAITGAFLLVAHPSGSVGILVPLAVLFVVAAVAFHAVTAMDAYRVASGAPQLVRPRALLIGTAGLMMLSVGSLFF